MLIENMNIIKQSKPIIIIETCTLGILISKPISIPSFSHSTREYTFAGLLVRYFLNLFYIFVLHAESNTLPCSKDRLHLDLSTHYLMKSVLKLVWAFITFLSVVTFKVQDS